MQLKKRGNRSDNYSYKINKEIINFLISFIAVTEMHIVVFKEVINLLFIIN